MNHARTPQILALQAGIVLVLMVGGFIWLGGCSDPRTEPLRPSEPAHTETIVLLENATSNGEVLAAPFTVAEPLAPIVNPSTDQPARLTVVAYIRPDSDILWREAIIGDSIPPLNDLIVQYLIALDHRERALNILLPLDSMCMANPDTCEALVDTLCAYNGPMCDSLGLQPANINSVVHSLQSDTALYHDSVDVVVADTTALGVRRDSLGVVLDDRYTLALWFDDSTAPPVYPEATYRPDGGLRGQGLYLAVTDTARQSATRDYKGRGFAMAMNRIDAADPVNPGYPLEVNWTTCFPGSERPCLNKDPFPHPHTLYARVSGADTKITATLVLVYEGTTP